MGSPPLVSDWQSLRNSLWSTFPFVFSMASSVLLTFANRAVFDHGFRNLEITILTFHQIVSHIYARFAEKLGWYENKEIPHTAMLWPSILSALYMGVMNWILSHTNVPLYQISKLLMLASVASCECFLFGRTRSWDIILSLALITAGIGAAMISDIPSADSAHVVIILLTGVAAGGVGQALISEYQKRYEVDSFSWMRQASFQLAIIYGLWAFVFEYPTIIRIPYIATSWGTLSFLLSCTCAFGVNISAALIMGKYSSTTYHVLGHVKTAFVLLVSFMIYGMELGSVGLLGCLVSLGGSLYYSFAPDKKNSK